MSETNPQAEGAPPPEPAAPATEAPAPAAEGAARETTDETKEPEPKPSRTDRRIAALSARLAASAQEQARQAQELEHYRRQVAPQFAEPTLTPEQQAAVDRVVEAKLAQRVEAERSESFHTQGRAAYPDWSERCQSLMQMGADAQFAQLLIETPDGAKVAGALADDPEELERITGLRSERARAIALGKFAATLESKPAAPARTSRAPAPIRPINGASARVEFDEHTATPQQLVEFYSKQAMAKRGL
jgi:hypothetical protein